MEQYMPAITMALLGGIVFTVGMALIIIERIKLRRKLEKTGQEPSTHAANSTQIGR
jgi:hypothetical protein